jgi:hypothetical protein
MRDTVLLSKAIANLYPNVGFSLDGDDLDTLAFVSAQSWNKAAIEAEYTRIQTEFDNKEYQRQRSTEYPPIGDQLDALFHAGVFPPEMAAQIQAIKDRYPKS